jgi:hypothetical protein
MKKDSNYLPDEVRADARQRLADRLGFLLAKRWIRIHQKPAVEREDQRPKPDDGKQK